MRKCTKCDKTKELALFSKLKNGTYHSWCKKCKSNINVENRAKNPEKERAKDRAHHHSHPRQAKHKQLMIKFGITIDQYEAMQKKQNNLCAICGRPETVMRAGKVKALAVDHNRITGEVRMLLCQRCNQSFGLLKESKTIINSMLSYAIKYGTE